MRTNPSQYYDMNRLGGTHCLIPSMCWNIGTNFNLQSMRSNNEGYETFLVYRELY